MVATVASHRSRRSVGMPDSRRALALPLGGARIAEGGFDRLRRIRADRLAHVAALFEGDLRQQAVAHHRARRLGRDVLRRRRLVTMLDEEPALTALIPPGSHQHPRAVKLLAGERELDLALG